MHMSLLVAVFWSAVCRINWPVFFVCICACARDAHACICGFMCARMCMCAHVRFEILGFDLASLCDL